MWPMPCGMTIPILRQQSSNLIGLRGARLDESLPGPMQRQHGLLLGVLDRHEAHVRPAHRLTDGFGIGHVVLVRLDIGLDELRGHQLHGVPERLQLPRPVMRAAARFHADQARRQVGEERHYLGALQLLLQHRLASLIDPMHLDHVLCQIDPNRRNLHLGRLSWLVEHSHIHLGTSMPLREGATIPLPAHHQPDRIDVRYRASSHHADEKLRVALDLPGSGIQADTGSREIMAPHPRRRTYRRTAGSHCLQGRRPGTRR